MAACPGPIPRSTIPTWHLRLFYYCHRHLRRDDVADCTPPDHDHPFDLPLLHRPDRHRVHCCCSCCCCCCDYYSRTLDTDPSRESTRSLHCVACGGAATVARVCCGVLVLLCWSPSGDSRDVLARSPRRSSRTGPCRVLERGFVPVLGLGDCGGMKRLEG